MAERYDFYVHDDRKITFNLTEPIMREDSGVTDFVFHIPKVLNELEVSDWQWWLVFVNAKKEKYSIALTLSDDPERPLEFNTATYTVDYAMSIKAGAVQFALEAINTGTGGAIDNEWHTLTYETKVKETLQGNQAEYAETESDIISALIIEVQNKAAQLVGGATPEPKNLVADMTDPKKVYLYVGNEEDESNGYWYYHNGTQFVPGGVYGAGVTDAVPTQGSTNAVQSGGVYDALHDTDTTLSQSGQAADAKETGDRFDDVKKEVADKFADVSNVLDMSLVEEVNKADTSSAKNASGATLISSYGFSNGAYFPIEYPIDAEKTYVAAMRYNNGDATRTCRWGFCDKEKNQIGSAALVNLSSGLVGQPSASGIIVYVTNSTNLNTIQSATIDWIQLVEQSVYNTHGGTEYEYIKPVYASERLNKIEYRLEENNSIYGIKIGLDGTVTRTDDAVELNNDYVIGNSYQNGGHNDFDSCYPWSGIKLCNIYVDENEDEQIVYFGEEGFSKVNKNTYVEIPKFYSLRYEDSDGNQYIKITGSPQRNFLIEPCFYDSVTGNVVDKIYVGVYHSSGENDLASVSGAIPTTDKPFSFFKENSEMYDFVTLMAIQKLFSIEFAAINTSLIFGGYSNLAWNNAIYPYVNATSTNTGEFIGDSRIKNLVVGSIISINQKFGVIENREITAITDPVVSGSRWIRTITFSGEPIDLIIPDGLPTADRQKLYCSAQKTGATDNLVYHTGRTDYNVGDPLLANQFRYRWMEGLWGTVGEFIDGVVVKNLRLYWDYIRANYGNVELSHKINFKIPLQNTYSTSPNPLPQYIKKMGIDFRHPQITVPLELTDDETFYGDGFYSVDTVGPDGQSFDANTIFVGCSSMAWDGRYANGLYCLRFWSPSTTGGTWLYGSRMIKRHFG